ncbi:uncharacterized protein troap isoform X2 [Dunckerocampus dactyliophorus]|uniref:uncharacterized protein troap isoform X2 n=1 Tax=Dunckerocampus dactyliophorus TaxID=161453 RepID=UPI0024055A61|nr:uncharacterized protein troap isoform X2 [Dunckerocampus dactyliophorus]
MDSSPVLRVQSQNKIQTGFPRTNDENNKMTVDPKNFQPLPVLHLPKKDSENQDPGSSKRSRLPVLIKTPRPAASNFTQWEEKAGKAKKKKPCTRPVPFITSKHNKAVVVASQPTTVLQSRSGACGIQLENNVRVKTQNKAAKPSKCSAVLKSAVDSNKGKLASHGMAGVASGQLGHSDTFNTKNVTHQSSTSSCLSSSVSVDVCLDSMTHLSLKDPTKICHSSQNMQNYLSNDPSGKAEKFQPDHTALLSILHNEGVRVQPSATPQSKPYLNLPQRVSVAKSHQKAPPATVRSVAFSPDPSALRSILQNEGVKAAGPMRDTSQNSSARHTSIYTAQRVPVRKNQTETDKGAVTEAENLWTPQRICNTRQPISARAQLVPVRKNLTETETEKLWTPQRVPNTRHQPMSAKKFHTTSTPRLRSYETKSLHQEEIVQRLFVDQEDGQNADKDGTQEEQLSVEASPIQTHCEGKVESNTTCGDEEEQQQREIQPFIPMLPRESVIFFSTGKKIIRTARFEKHESSVHRERHGPAPSELGKVCEPIKQINPVNHVVHRDHKACVTNTTVALLRKRLPPMEELRLDEEVSFYISPSVSDDPASHHLRPGCRNPVAYLLHFEESTRFVPLSFDASPYCLSLQYK